MNIIGRLGVALIIGLKKFANDVVIGKSSVLGKPMLWIGCRSLSSPFMSKFFIMKYILVGQIKTHPDETITKAGINGSITEFPLTAARYKRKWPRIFSTKGFTTQSYCQHRLSRGNRCLGRNKTAPYMSPFQPGFLSESSVFMIRFSVSKSQEQDQSKKR
ncbi:hypothetical protein YC2023_079528 [Brassica napus]